MDYLTLKVIHFIFIVTWFSGLFYVVRLFIYNTEANEKTLVEKNILQAQFKIMTKRLWLGITWPSAIITLIVGLSLIYKIGWADWLLWKMFFLVGLYAYHFSLHLLYKQQQKGIFKYSSTQLRMWNEVATLFLVAIISIAFFKSALSLAYSIFILVGLTLVLFMAIFFYKKIKNKK